MNPDIQTEAAIWPVDNATYHADVTAVSHTSLEVFRKSRPRYHGIYVTGEIERPAPSDAMVLGAAFHCAALQPELFAEWYAIAPKCDRRTTVGKATWQKFLDEAGGRIPLTVEDNAIVWKMRCGITVNPIAEELLDRLGPVEQPITWDDETGVKLKCLPDKLVGDIVVDLKSCRDASPAGFARACANFGYARQAALYLAGVETLLGKPAKFLFVAVENSEPYRCFVYDIEPADVKRAVAENFKDIDALARCRESGNWHDLGWDTVTRIAMPAYSNNPWELDDERDD